MVNYFKSLGRVEGRVPPRPGAGRRRRDRQEDGLADKFKGTMQLPILGNDYEVVVDQRDNWGESGFTLTLKRTGRGSSGRGFPRHRPGRKLDGMIHAHVGAGKIQAMLVKTRRAIDGLIETHFKDGVSPSTTAGEHSLQWHPD